MSVDDFRHEKFKKKLGFAIGKRRVQQSKSRNDICKASGVAPSTIQALEEGKSDPQLSTFLAICTALASSPATGVELLKELLSEVLDD